MMKNRLICTIAAGFSLFSVGCEEPDTCADVTEPNPLPHYSIDDKYKEYFMFNHGSWWIYHDNAFNQTDSVYVENQGCKTLTYFNSCNIRTATDERCGTTFKSQYHPYTYSDSLVEDQDGNIYIDRNLESGYKDIFYSRWPAGTSETVYKVTENTSVVSNNVTYTDVIKIQLFYSSVYHTSGLSEEAHYYFAKNIGMVKREYPNSNRTWKLINYNIVQ